MGLAGTWYNQLSSKMSLTDDGSGGLTGSYVSTVGKYAGSPFPLRGSYDANADTTQPFVVGFLVVWSLDPNQDAGAVTTWSGQYDPSVDEIITTWLLTSATGAEPYVDWNSTLVGQDEFGRSQSATAELGSGSRRRGVSNP